MVCEAKWSLTGYGCVRARVSLSPPSLRSCRGMSVCAQPFSSIPALSAGRSLWIEYVQLLMIITLMYNQLIMHAILLASSCTRVSEVSTKPEPD